MMYDSKRWLSLSACFFASLCAGFGYAWSVFTKPMLDMFNWTASDVSLSFPLIMSTAAATAIVAGKALEYIQPKNLLLIGGCIFGGGIICIGFTTSLAYLYICAFITGIGLGTVYPGATMSNIVRLFPDRRGMSSGILTAGYGVGALVWAPVAVGLISSFSLMDALKILGALYGIIIAIMSRLVVTSPENYSPTGWNPPAQEQSGDTDMNWKQMMRTPAFYVLAAVFIFGTISGMMAVGHASPIAQEILNLTPRAAGFVVGFLAIGMVLGKVIWGAVSDRTGRFPVFFALFIISAIAMFAMSAITAYVPFVIAMAAVGLCYGGFLSLIAPVTADAFGQKHLGINFGIMFLALAIAAYIGPMIAAVMKEANNGDYTQAFVLGGCINIIGLAAVLGFMAAAKKKK